jgi:septum formation protein
MDWIKKCNLILASGSPRRKELLEKSGFDFTVRKIGFDEYFPENLNKRLVAQYLAEKKLKQSIRFLQLNDNDIVITADTVVINNDELLGKPESEEQAKLLLKSLSGNRHEVITGVCFGNVRNKICFSSVSKVYFDILEPDEIEYYINNYNTMDKAGAYGIQDWIGICKIIGIEGSYTNIMGFPTQLFFKKLKEFVIKLN